MKFIKALLTMFVLLVASSAYTEKTNASTQNSIDWYINSTESFTGVSKDAPIWHVLQETKLGIFAYDERSLSYAIEKDSVDKNTVVVTVKTVFTDKNALKQLQDKYASKLQGKEKPQYWLLKMRFDMAQKLYTIDKTEYYTNPNTLLDTVERKGDMIALTACLPLTQTVALSFSIKLIFHTEGPVQAVDITPDGTMIAGVEAPAVTPEGKIIGAYKLHIWKLQFF